MVSFQYLCTESKDRKEWARKDQRKQVALVVVEVLNKKI
jgi:hypothetical protein